MAINSDIEIDVPLNVGERPEPRTVQRVRFILGLTQEEAAQVCFVKGGRFAWSRFESETSAQARRMPAVTWAWFLSTMGLIDPVTVLHDEGCQ